MPDAAGTQQLDAALRPLEGVRVLSLAQQLPGPYCGMLLADLGAEVILVEQIPHGDPGRISPALTSAMHRGKRSVALDLKSAAGLEAFHRLTRTAAVVLEGFRPGVAGRLGVDYKTLSALRLGLVYCSISGYGQDGPSRLVPGHDLSYQARAGAVRTDEGHTSGLPVADLSSAMFAALAVVAALAATPGTGRYIDVSMTESVLSWNSMAVTSAVTGADGGPRGGEPAYGLFRTADGWITLSIAHEDHFWRALCEALESPDRALLTRGERHAARDELRSWLAAALESASSAEWLERLEAAGVPAGRVNDPRSTLDDPLFRDRGAFQTIDGQLYVLTPMMLDGRRLPVTGPAPGVGEHTRDYLLEVGYGESEVDQLAAEGAVMLGAGQA